MSSEVLLYDLRSKQGVSFALNPWKTRALLNYKSIPYRTHWLEYPDVAPTLSAAGVAAHPAGSYAAYTTPVIRFQGTHTADSLAIAGVLEAAFPTPAVHLDDARLPRVIAALDAVVGAILCEYVARVPRNVLAPRSAEYWRRTRAEWVGMDVDEYEWTQSPEKAWAVARPHLRLVADLVKEGGGPFIHGEAPGYADILVASMLRSYRFLDEGIYQRFVEFDSAFEVLFEAARPWLERDGW